MDCYQRRERHFNSWLKLIFSLGSFCLLYLFLIRPIQSILVADLVVPALKSYTEAEPDFEIVAIQDDFWIESHSNRFMDLFINLPFNGYFWLTATILWALKKKIILKVIVYYNLALFVIHPVLIFILLNKNYWIAPWISAHEMVYKSLFLSLGVLFLKEGLSRKNDIEIRMR